MNLPKRTLVLVAFLIILLTACQAAPKAVAVSPISGLPSGTDGYPWWNDTVFYEVFLRSFYDSNGDGTGDINGLIDKLDYLNDGNPKTTHDLGVTGIWLMPIQPASSYHGYDVTDYYNINPDYGSLNDFKRLLAEAHKRGIRVIIDFVLNHTSDRHPWFQAAQAPSSPYRNWYVWSPTQLDANLWHPGTSGYYYGFFGASMPDLNYTNPAVTAKMEDVARFWLQDVGVDGFRLDAAMYLIEEGNVSKNSEATHVWYNGFRTFYKSINPHAMTVGEVDDVAPTAAEYAQGDQLDLTFDFSLAQAMITSVRAQNTEEVRRVAAADLAAYKPGQFGAFLTNHDQNRTISQLANQIEKAKSAAALLLTSSGVPFIYYGEEIGISGIKPDEELRTPMLWTAGKNAGFTNGSPWEPLTQDYTNNRDVADEEGDPNSLLSYYRTLIQLRNQHAALRVGSYQLIDASAPAIFACLRVSQGEAVLVLANLSSGSVSNFKLNVSSSLLKGSYKIAPLLGNGSFAAPLVNDQGGFDGYQPVSQLAGNTSVILQLQSQVK